jgi:hypothetical protein
LQSVAEAYIIDCVKSKCTIGDSSIDISSAGSIYNYYCSSKGFPANVPATTTQAGAQATTTVYVTVCSSSGVSTGGLAYSTVGKIWGLFFVFLVYLTCFDHIPFKIAFVFPLGGELTPFFHRASSSPPETSSPGNGGGASTSSESATSASQTSTAIATPSAISCSDPKWEPSPDNWYDANVDYEMVGWWANSTGKRGSTSFVDWLAQSFGDLSHNQQCGIDQSCAAPDCPCKQIQFCITV